MDWDDPKARAHLNERVGHVKFNELIVAEARRRFKDGATIAVTSVNGYRIKSVNSDYGQLFEIEDDGTNDAYQTLADAEAAAATLEPRA